MYCVCQGSRSDLITTGGLQNGDRYRPHCVAALSSTAERTATHRAVPHGTASLNTWCSLVPFHDARTGVMFDIANCWSNFECSGEAEIQNAINDVGRSLLLGFVMEPSCSLVPVHSARADVNCWCQFWCSVKAENSTICFFNDDELCPFTLCVRGSYLKVWTFDATFHAQWKPRIWHWRCWLKLSFRFFLFNDDQLCLSPCSCGHRICRSELWAHCILHVTSEVFQNKWAQA